MPPGPLLAPFWLPKVPPGAPKRLQMAPNGPKWRSKTGQNRKSWKFKKHMFSQCFLMKNDAGKHTNGRLKRLWMTFESSKSISIFDVFFWVHSGLLAASFGRFLGGQEALLGAIWAPLGSPWGSPGPPWGSTFSSKSTIILHTSFCSSFGVLLGHSLLGAILAPQRTPGHSTMNSIVHFSSPIFVYLRLLFLMFAYLCVLVLILVLAWVLILAFAY